MESLKGRLLVATPRLLDPSFSRSVVLVAEHTDEGALGVILNRVSELEVEDATPELGELAGEDAMVHIGGPVQPSSIVVVAEWDEPELAGLLIFDDVGFLPAESELEVLPALTRRARVFAGYAGWGAGQLDGEVERDDWWVAEATAEDVFAEEPEALWAEVLQRKGGQYALVARMPEDPSLN